MRKLAVILGLAAAVTSAGAQREPGQERFTWLSVSAGIMKMTDVGDGGSLSTWRFGSGFPVRIAVEREIDFGTSIGLQLTYARMPLVYQSWTTNIRSNAHGTVASYGPILRLRRGTGFYQAIEIFAGAMQYGSFTDDATGENLPPERANLDFAFSLGLGLGVPLARDWAMELMGTYITVIHDRTNLASNTQTTREHMAITLGLRLGL